MVEFLQVSRPKTLSFGPVYDEKSFKALFLEGDTRSVCKTKRHWWAEHHHASMEDLVQRVESLLYLQETPLQKEKGNSKQSKYRNERHITRN